MCASSKSSYRGDKPAAIGAAGWRAWLHELVFEADTPKGKRFDLLLLVVIILSVVAVSLESVRDLREHYGTALRVTEWVFTILFTIEYGLRLAAVRRPARFAVSFYGLVDLLAILPTYLSLFIPGAQSLLVIRALRLLRVFRILKLTEFLGEARMLGAAVRGSMRKVIVFIGAVLTVVLIAGAAMYVVEGEAHGFTSIPMAAYWAVVTMTTVGFGDVVPETVAGRVIASILMIMGYGLIAVPTGIVTVKLSETVRNATNTQACPSCGAEGHANDARFCKYCGAKL